MGHFAIFAMITGHKTLNTTMVYKNSNVVTFSPKRQLKSSSKVIKSKTNARFQPLTHRILAYAFINLPVHTDKKYKRKSHFQFLF